MHGPWRANPERSNQSAREQSAQPEETPPRRAGKRAKACQRAISMASYRSEWTSRPASLLQKTGRSLGEQTRAWLPAPRTVFTRKFVLQAGNQRPLQAGQRFPIGTPPGQRFNDWQAPNRIRSASSRSNPNSGAFQAGRCLLHRTHKDTAFLRTKFVSRRGFDFVLRSLPSPRAELRGN